MISPGDMPSGRKAAAKLFGDPAAGEALMKRRLTLVTKLPGWWNNGAGKLYMHELAEPYIRAALDACMAAGILEELDTIGCYCRRRIRHGTNGPWSYHASGVAVDINAAANRSRWLPSGTPEPFSDAWRELWPSGISAELVACWEGAGWTWGGRWGVGRKGRVFCDPMHMQLPRR